MSNSLKGYLENRYFMATWLSHDMSCGVKINHHSSPLHSINCPVNDLYMLSLGYSTVNRLTSENALHLLVALLEMLCFCIILNKTNEYFCNNHYPFPPLKTIQIWSLYHQFLFPLILYVGHFYRFLTFKHFSVKTDRRGLEGKVNFFCIKVIVHPQKI